MGGCPGTRRMVVRRRTGGTGGGITYELSEAGRELRPLLAELARVGSRWLDPPTSATERFELAWALASVASRLSLASAPGRPLRVHGETGDFLLKAEPASGRVALHYLPAGLDDLTVADAVLRGPDDRLLALISGHVGLADSGTEIAGDRTLAVDWLEAVIGSFPAPLRGRSVPTRASTERDGPKPGRTQG